MATAAGAATQIGAAAWAYGTEVGAGIGLGIGNGIGLAPKDGQGRQDDKFQ